MPCANYVKLCTLGVLALGVSLVSWIVMMCVVNKLFELLEFVFDSVYVDLQYDEISLAFIVVSVVIWSSLLCLWGCRGTLCGYGGCCDCDACTVVCVAWVSAERVWWCEVDGNASVEDGWGVESAGHVGGTRGSGVVYNAADVLWMSVVLEVWGVGGVCEMCMCLARGGVGGAGGEWMRGLGLGFTNPVGTGGVLDVCLCFGCGGVGAVDGE